MATSNKHPISHLFLVLSSSTWYNEYDEMVLTVNIWKRQQFCHAFMVVCQHVCRDNILSLWAAAQNVDAASCFWPNDAIKNSKPLIEHSCLTIWEESTNNPSTRQWAQLTNKAFANKKYKHLIMSETKSNSVCTSSQLGNGLWNTYFEPINPWQDLHDDNKTCMQSSYWELILENGQ
jgi:hypothetical protein